MFYLGGFRLFVLTVVATLQCFLIRLLRASIQRQEREYFRSYHVSQAVFISGDV